MAESRLSTPRILVAGIGNIFLGDDGFGPQVARRLLARALPEGVRVVDYGVGGIHLAYDVLDGVGLLVLVDTVSRDVAPGTLALVEVGSDDLGTAGVTAVDAHAMDPVSMLATVRTLGGQPPRTLLVGCQPAELEERLGLSEVVEAAVEYAVDAVLELLDDELLDDGAGDNGTRDGASALVAASAERSR